MILKSPNIKFRILHKGLLILMVTLVLQVVLFVALFFLADKAEKLAAQEAQLSKLNEVTTELVYELGGAISVMGYRIHRHFRRESLPTGVDPDAFLNRMTANTALVRRLGQGIDAPIARNLTGQCEKVTMQVYELLRSNALTINETTATSMTQFIATLGTIKNLHEEEDAALEQYRQRNRITQQNIKLQLLSGILVEIILTTALFVWFLTDITKRLAVLVSNARLLPSGEPLRVIVSDWTAWHIWIPSCTMLSMSYVKRLSTAVP